MEQSFVMIKPDAVGRALVGEIIRRFERRGFKLVALKMQILSQAQAEAHYKEHVGKPFYEGLAAFITSGPSVQMVWEGKDVVQQIRKMNGATNCLEAGTGTIRGDFGLSNQKNLIHASDSVETAAREIALYFEDHELVRYDHVRPEWFE
ncbi:MAG: nucleoside-diphosphate kinase [Candidatus Hydrogenedentes bacterium]|nr:nucleoside-diphosphate kinase [Candidatus Hydrogenedentota bacterium]